MRFELILLIITGLVIFNIYTEGKLLKKALTWKKYYKMAGVAFGAFMVYWLFKKNPSHAKDLLLSSNEYIKYLPVDRNTTNILGPILDFTKKQSYRSENFTGIGGNNTPILDMNSMYNNRIQKQKIKMNQNQPTKRSVSESRKKMIAASQQWRCSHCKEQLDFNYQIDHIIRLEYGGSNDPSNLTALCPNCHSKKTILEHHANSSI